MPSDNAKKPPSPPLSPAEAEDKIKECARLGRIEYAPTEEIEDHEGIAREFLAQVLDLVYDECFISDESSLSDFRGCGIEDEEYAALSAAEFATAWDIAIKAKIDGLYGIEVSPRDRLVAIFERLRQARLARRN